MISPMLFQNQVYSSRRSILETRLIAAIALISAHTPAIAATFYVASWGKDSNPGTQSLPLKHLGSATSKLNAGDTLYVRGGTYVETLRVRKSGTASAPIQIKGYPGERAIIDGQKRLASNWGTMVALVGNYVYMNGFEIKNGLGQGVILSGHHNRLSNSDIHDHAERGVLASGDYSIVEYSKVWGNAWYNCRLSTCPPTKYRGGWGTGLSAARDRADGITDNAILRGNTVFNNCGEGLSSFEANGTILDGNTVYDNWSANLYVSDSRNTLVIGNLVYSTPNSKMGKTSTNIGLADETGRPLSENLTIVNNVVKGGSPNLSWWLDKRTPQGKMKNVLIAYNTFADAALTSRYSAAIAFGPAAHTNVRFSNNIVKQDGLGKPINLGTGDFTFSANLWSKAPSLGARAWNDVLANPQLTLSGATGAGQLTGGWFRLAGSSPAIDAGTVISTVRDDYFGIFRDSTPDIGASEH